MRLRIVSALLICGVLTAAARAELPADIGRGPSAATLPVPASKHWVWVNDFVFPHMADGMAYLVDGDSGRYLGHVEHGLRLRARGSVAATARSSIPPKPIFRAARAASEPTSSRLYDPGTLKPLGEIAIPPKRSSNLPMMANSVLTDDERFLLIYNFNPAQSVTVVDTATRKFVREVETPGCALIYPTGPRSFFSVCGDGSLSLVELDDVGAAQQKRTQPLFNMSGDPVTEKAVRINDTWYFVSFAGRIYPLKAGPQQAVLGTPWWLTSEAERKAGWRSGGVQQLAANPQKSLLYAIMHRGGPETHKDPGKDVWVFDVSTGQRVQQFALKNLSSAIQLTHDEKPLLFSTFIETANLDIYDAANGKWLRSVEHVGTSPTIMVTP